MEIVQEQQENLQATIKVKISPEDYKEKVETSLRDHKKKVDLKGFRKGHVPTNLVKKMFGKQILAQEVLNLINENISKHISDNKIEILGDPLPLETERELEFDINKQTEYEFNYEIGLKPEIDITLLKDNPSFPFYKIQITDDMLNEELDYMRKQQGSYEDAEESDEDSLLEVEFTQLDAENNPVDGGVVNNGNVAISMLREGEQKSKMMALKKGDVIIGDPFDLMDKTKAQMGKEFLGIEEDKLEEAGENFSMKLLNIRNVKPAELNEEFIKRIGGEGIKTEDELKEKLKNDLRTYLDQQSTIKLNKKIADDLIEKTEIPLPDVFLKRWIKTTNEKPITDEALEGEYDDFARGLKWEMIVNKIVSENDIKVDKEEIEHQAKQQLKKYFGMPEDQELPDDQWDKLKSSLYENDDYLKKTYNHLMEEKLFDYLKGSVALKESELTRDEFLEIN